MYKAKIAILYTTKSGKLIWEQWYEDWEPTDDMSGFLDCIYQDELKRWRGHESCTKLPRYVVCLETIDISNGKYHCNQCECYFDKFDSLISDTNCPFCCGTDFIEASIMKIKAKVYYQDFGANASTFDDKLTFIPAQATFIHEFEVKVDTFGENLDIMDGIRNDVAGHCFQELNTNEELKTSLQPVCKIAGHTSMSIGDYIVFDDGEVRQCRANGWKVFTPEKV